MFSIDPDILKKFQKKVPRRKRSEAVSAWMEKVCDGRVKV